MDTSKLKQEETDRDIPKRKVILDRDNLPLHIFYKGKRYILLLTKNDKLILNRYED